jgi:N,N'-diacetyllegionaminate synthase
MFLSSPFDIDSIDMLNELGLEIFKIPSGEIVNLPYLRKIGTLNKKVILSTGMAEMEEIKDALDVIVDSGTRKENITVLHCNTEYPTPYEDVNLRAMLTIKEAFDISVGYSDHTPGIDVAIAAVALGAEVIEKHFTLDRNMEGPDHKASLEADELKSMVVAIRNIETAFGNGVKKPSASEIENRAVVRKSIVASRPIKKGELFTEESITVKRPGIGISPMKWDNVIGRTSKKNFEKDGIIEL